jgi:mannan endo-1,4-beta-mannosidase
MKSLYIFLRLLTYIFITILYLQCNNSSDKALNETRRHMVDSNATKETIAMYFNLKQITGKKILFGQQDYASDGHGWKNLKNRCDVKEVCASYPALCSFDFLHYTNPSTMEKKDTNYLNQLIKDIYNRGGVVSFCWHYYNPVTGGLFYDTTVVVKHILPGGLYHEKFKTDLKIIAGAAHYLRGKNNELIPIIFRPWHEFDGNWFWWGKNHCSPEEFKSLYRFTVTYLKDSMHVNNFLYAFSPDCKFNSETEYLERYPGDNYVDIVGMDNYWDFTNKGGGIENVVKKCRVISDYAKKANKMAAITETGLANLTDTLWYTSKLLKVLKDKETRLTYVAVWRGEYVPYPGHAACNDFIKFRRDTMMMFESDLPDM